MILYFDNLFPYSPCVAIELGQLTRDSFHSGELPSTTQSGAPLSLCLMEALTKRSPLDQLRVFSMPSRSALQANLQLSLFAGFGGFSGGPDPGAASPPHPPGSQRDSCPRGGVGASLA